MNKNPFFIFLVSKQGFFVKQLPKREEKLESIEESHNEIIAKLIKERDHAHAKYKVTKKARIINT